MWQLINQPENISFAVALALMLMFGVLELMSLFLGGISDWLDQLLPESLLEMDTDVELGAGLQLLSWLYIGRVPVLMWLVVFLAVYSVVGLVGQQLIYAITGEYLAGWLAGGLVFILALPLVRLSAAGLYQVLPKDFTTAIHSEQLVGCLATIVLGEAREGYPAQAKVYDQFGQVHYVMVEPDTGVFRQGERVLLVAKREQIFTAVAERIYETDLLK